MKEAILNYESKARNKSNFCSDSDFSDVAPDIKCHIDKGEYFIKRKKRKRTDISTFKDIFGYDLPTDIDDYINLYWHPCIYGYYKIPECIVLFSCYKKINETENDLLFQKNGIVEMGISWRDNYKGDIKNYLPIGLKGYSGSYILYEISTGRIFEENFYEDGKPCDKPFANSLKELIMNLSFTAN